MRTARGLGGVGGLALLAGVALAGCTPQAQGDPVSVGLITKQEENPYWVSMREVAQETADDLGAQLTTATGTGDDDVASQEEAIARMVQEGVDGILITPTDPVALEPAIAAAREAGVLVLALDTPPGQADAVDATFTTDNEQAGRLVGEYAAAKIAELGVEPRAVMLDMDPSVLSAAQRHTGFLDGFGFDAESATFVAAEVDTEGDRDNAAVLMTELIAEHPDINVVYTVNEPVALGALAALESAGADLDDIVLVSVDGGCRAMREAVRPGLIDATATQYPQNMAREGVRAVVAAVRDDAAPTGVVDTGTELVSDNPVPGVDSRRVEFGIRTCWGS